jgi:hypothetical protein
MKLGTLFTKARLPFPPDSLRGRGAAMAKIEITACPHRGGSDEERPGELGAAGNKHGAAMAAVEGEEEK